MSDKISTEISEEILETLLCEIMKDGKFEEREKDAFNKLYRFLKVKKARFLQIKKQVQDGLRIQSSRGSLDFYVLLEKIHKSLAKSYDDKKAQEIIERIALILSCTEVYDRFLAEREAKGVSPKALYEEALALEETKSGKPDYKKIRELYATAANLGFGEAQQALAFMYFSGLGTRKNQPLAFKWYKRAAEQGLPVAQCNLAALFASGRGIEADNKEASHWYGKAAKQGNAKAQFNLGYNYMHAKGVSQDYQKAIKWYTEAANQGFPAAEHNLGLLYFEGHGVEKDHRQAMLWFGKAAAKDYAPSKESLAQMKQELEESVVR